MSLARAQLDEMCVDDGLCDLLKKVAVPSCAWQSDGCGGPRSSVVAMNAALNATKRPIVYSINSPGSQVNATNPQFANLWRTTPDTSNTYVSMLTTAVTNNNATLTVTGSKSAWNDAE